MSEQRDPMADMSMIKKWQYLDDLYELATVVLPHWINRAVEAEARVDRLLYSDTGITAANVGWVRVEVVKSNGDG